VCDAPYCKSGVQDLSEFLLGAIRMFIRSFLFVSLSAIYFLNFSCFPTALAKATGWKTRNQGSILLLFQDFRLHLTAYPASNMLGTADSLTGNKTAEA
jgi:hypothetical protein